jgi:hypothetical protein
MLTTQRGHWYCTVQTHGQGRMDTSGMEVDPAREKKPPTAHTPLTCMLPASCEALQLLRLLSDLHNTINTCTLTPPHEQPYTTAGAQGQTGHKTWQRATTSHHCSAPAQPIPARTATCAYAALTATMTAAQSGMHHQPSLPRAATSEQLAHHCTATTQHAAKLKV